MMTDVQHQAGVKQGSSENGDVGWGRMYTEEVAGRRLPACMG